MYIVAVLSQKGGAGKTTVACALAVAAEAAGRTAVLVDLDPQGTATTWGRLREADTPVVTTIDVGRLGPVLEAARDAGAALAVVDTAPHVSDDAYQAAAAADRVLIPCRAAAADLAAIGATVALVRQAGTPANAVLNAAPIRSPLVDQARAALDGYGIEAAPVVLHQRVDHVHAYTRGQTAAEYAPRGKAAAELRQLFAWLTQGDLDLGP